MDGHTLALIGFALLFLGLLFVIWRGYVWVRDGLGDPPRCPECGDPIDIDARGLCDSPYHKM